MGKQRVRIRLRTYDHRLIDKTVQDLVSTAKRTGAKVVGPIPLPTRINRYTVLRSPHVDRKSREQFEVRTHKRLVEIVSPTPDTMEALTKLEMPAGIDIEVKL